MEKMIFAADALAGQICLVTGASRGIGRAVFEAFLQAGAVVIGTATSEAGAAALDEAGKAFEGRGRGIVLNVCDAEASKKAVDDIVAEYGRIDVLINNAGITKDGLVMRMKDEQWETVIETDLTAAFRLAARLCSPDDEAALGPHHFHVLGRGGDGQCRSGELCGRQGGLVGMTMSLAREIGSRGITVNCIAPGFIDTDMTKDLPEEHKTALIGQTALGRLGQTDDVANACLYLASPAGAYVTGIVLHVNGGMYMG